MVIILTNKNTSQILAYKLQLILLGNNSRPFIIAELLLSSPDLQPDKNQINDLGSPWPPVPPFNRIMGLLFGFPLCTMECVSGQRRFVMGMSSLAGIFWGKVHKMIDHQTWENKGGPSKMYQICNSKLAGFILMISVLKFNVEK